VEDDFDDYDDYDDDDEEEEEDDESDAASDLSADESTARIVRTRKILPASSSRIRQLPMNWTASRSWRSRQCCARTKRRPRLHL
jgi:hypothetical protein